MDYRTPHAETISLGPEPPPPPPRPERKHVLTRELHPLLILAWVALVVAAMVAFGPQTVEAFRLVSVPVIAVAAVSWALLSRWRARARAANAPPTTARRVGGSVEIGAPAGTTTVPLEAVRRTTLAAKGLRGPAPALAFGTEGVVACKTRMPEDWRAGGEVAAARWFVDPVTFRELEAAFLPDEPPLRQRIEAADELDESPDAEVDDARAVRQSS